ncbi:hypothetical protein HY643_02415 [Candidatus Woesearchaeota archaeon]|nr:hypothetical protein [Candidatus Woesearchaeota archaeon]
MGLEIFGKTEKPIEESKLQVIVSEEAVVDELLAYFNQYVTQESAFSKFLLEKSSIETNRLFLEDLASFQITKGVIEKVMWDLEKRGEGIWDTWKTYRVDNGTFLSPLIQISYNQNPEEIFKFGRVEEFECFCNYLNGTKEKPVKMEIKSLHTSSYFDSFYKAKHFIAKIGCAGGARQFICAEDFCVEITKASCSSFGFGTKRGKVYSMNEDTLDRLGKSLQFNRDPEELEFIEGRMPKEKWG